MSHQSDIMVNVVYPCVSLKGKNALKLFLASTTAMNTGEENDKRNSHTLSLIPSPSISPFLSLFLTVCLTHSPSLTGSDEGSRPSNESKCPFPWQLQILDSQNKEIHHCCCNNLLFLPDYSWPKMA